MTVGAGSWDRLSRSVQYRSSRRRQSVSEDVCNARRTLAPRGTVALTFDDGPDAAITPLVLDALASAGAVATFFCIGERARRHPDLLARMVREGHAVGSHSNTHRDTWTLDRASLRSELVDGHDAVEVGAGPTRLFRPPKGYLNLRLAVAARRKGLDTWLWSVDPKDWQPSSATAIADACDQLADGDVILLHDGAASEAATSGLDKGQTIDAIPKIVARIRDLGLEPSNLAR